MGILPVNVWILLSMVELPLLQIFYKDCNGHPVHELILIPKEKEENGKVGGKIRGARTSD